MFVVEEDAVATVTDPAVMRFSWCPAPPTEELSPMASSGYNPPLAAKKNASGYNIFSSRRSRMIPMNSTCFLMFFESQKMEETINNDLGRSTESEVKR
ncbi:hypothetical protein DY000_02029688 [Brassica cretica]|uniref:Uncharacterized protein n=1 Tax=Brassica cretica TaxID=69181 RepID=A0ABQ7DTG3_BRACR|nr:hypothetical protein DY000_02029688 [Brassica cretica]